MPLRKLLHHAELERWTKREKLLQLKLHLVGQAEQLYEVLPDKAKASFWMGLKGAVEKRPVCTGTRLQMAGKGTAFCLQLWRQLAEEQHKQLNEFHSRHSTDKVQPR